MQPPSSRTGAWRTHHQRVVTGWALDALDMEEALQYGFATLATSVREMPQDAFPHAKRAKDAREDENMGRLEGKSVVITGAGSGIGRAASLMFTKEGAKLIAVDKTDAVDETVKLVRAAGGTAEAMKADAGLEQDVAAVVGKAVSAYGKLDVVWANAGISGGSVPLHDQTVEQWQEI